ncbi:hypothetical protein KR032_009622 [Drosophila birchii]|nr:hypothetical protein KR032_009622 [Drosophila birchii]
MENEINSTPPALATVGLHRNRGVTETLNRRFKGPKKLVASSTVDELFVSRPQFKKKNMANDQEIKEKGEDMRMTNDLEGSSSTPINPRKINLADDQEMEEKGDENWVTHDLKVSKSTTIDPSFRTKNLEDDQEMGKKADDLNIPSDLTDPRFAICK